MPKLVVGPDMTNKYKKNVQPSSNLGNRKENNDKTYREYLNRRNCQNTLEINAPLWHSKFECGL